MLELMAEERVEAGMRALGDWLRRWRAAVGEVNLKGLSL